MAEFFPAFEFMLPHEGGYSFDPSDHGGKTKFGISQAAYPNLDIESLTLTEAQEIYERDYWTNAYSRIDSQDVANKVFDMAVNMGHSQAHKIVQRACIECSKTVKVDGFLGDKSILAINSIPDFELLTAIRAAAERFYRELVYANPQDERFLDGWIARANA